jgi:hypothetical protein
MSGDAGAVVETRVYDDAKGRRRMSLATCSDLSIEEQVIAGGSTWLDRQLLAKDPPLARGGLAPRCETQWTRAWITSWSKDSLVGKDSASCSHAICSRPCGVGSCGKLACPNCTLRPQEVRRIASRS